MSSSTAATFDPPSSSTGLAKRTSAGTGKWYQHGLFKVAVLIGLFLVVWQISTQFAPTYDVPTISSVADEVKTILTTSVGLQSLFTTLARVLVGLVSAFVVGLGLGLAMGASKLAAGYLLPIVRFVQGIPSLSWVIVAVIWFPGTEIRVWFVMVLVTLPGFALQTYDSYRAIPAELQDMARAFRPSRWSMYREITFPAITPGLFTAWKVNLGLGIRMVLIAELVGATVGVGYQLLNAQQLFDMASVVAWTLLLAISMLILQGIVELIESRALRYRAAPASATRPVQAVAA